MKKMFLTAALVLSLCLGFPAAFAAAAPGDIIGLTDFNAPSPIRPNTYTDDINSYGGSYTMNIALVVDDGDCGTIYTGFPTVEAALSVKWSQNTSGMGNGYIETSTYTAVFSPNLGGYYLSVD
ncbi:MAG: hypothetical protein LBU13_08525, partial [Synergistaceae bacterium]|nr:hypothetical protein [Synergistaceae bacterium]